MAWLWANKLAALALVCFVAAEAGTVGIVRMAVVVAAAGDMVAGCMAVVAAVVVVSMVRKVS